MNPDHIPFELTVSKYNTFIQCKLTIEKPVQIVDKFLSAGDSFSSLYRIKCVPLPCIKVLTATN